MHVYVRWTDTNNFLLMPLEIQVYGFYRDGSCKTFMNGMLSVRNESFVWITIVIYEKEKKRWWKNSLSTAQSYTNEIFGDKLISMHLMKNDWV